MNTAELAVHSKIKENCFRLLSACFYEPQKELLIEGDLFKNLTLNLQQLCPGAAVFSGEMERNLLAYTEEELRVDYAKLFVGPFELAAPPYGSVYLDEGGRVMGDSTMRVIEAYQREGLSKDNDFKDLPDHIAVELEFMSYLSYKEGEALMNSDAALAEKYAQKQKYFIDAFMHPWVPRFCKKIKEGTENGLYQSLAACLYTFVKEFLSEAGPNYSP